MKAIALSVAFGVASGIAFAQERGRSDGASSRLRLNGARGAAGMPGQTGA